MDNEAPQKAEDRKDSHLRICLEEEIERLDVTTGFERYRYEHDALPELNLKNIQLDTVAFGKPLAAPIMIGAMTGGTEKASQINQILAQAAEQCGVAMGLGSQRKMLDQPETDASFQVRDVAPNLLLMGNVGAVQFNYGVTAADINSLIDRSGCDVFALHLNPLQEAIQPEGDTDFSNLHAKLAEIIPEIKVPVIIKEVGAGLGEKSIRKLAQLPIAGVETAGVGGTSWSKIESYRTNSWIQQMTGRRLASWGVPTAESLQIAVRLLGERHTIICSGGIRTGLQIAKALTLGADLVACALPFLKAANNGGLDAVIMTIEQLKDELRTVMFVTGSKDLSALKQQELTLI
ncbi:MAG TPA: type 2 isopentenyl-diphosphate Delta-isomerase [Myxococcales bacterium]|nr:type 2 isopentenyl-diphosphate Delta-isomerase [Myxococcales bacterium]HIN86001.1 type 2 isopentenyl-diphosphate Delta-isomerase [Myxococcales bacterium]